VNGELVGDMVEAVEKEGLVVVKRHDMERRQVKMVKGEESYFALLAKDLLEISEKYRRDIDEVHKVFFEVSCDRDRLIKTLEGSKVERW
jgi:hypothetical protein